MTHQSVLPDLWINVRLQDVCEIIGGGTPDRARAQYYGGTIPWATPADVTSLDSQWLHDTKEYLTEEGLKNSSARLLPTGTVLMTSRATIGVTAIAVRPMATNQGFANYICDDTVLFNEFLACFLPAIKAKLEQLAGQTTFREITKSTLSSVSMPLPPLSEQRYIVDILRRADELRRLRREANQRANDLLPALFQEAFGSPDSWENPTPLGKLVRFVGGGTPNRKVERYFQGSIPWATSKDIKSRYLTDTQEHVTEEAVASSATNLVPAGTILVVVKSKILMHTLPVGITTRPFCFGQDIKGLVCNPGVEPVFIVSAMLAQSKRILQMARGVNTEGLTLEHLASILVPRVSAQTQSEFVQLVKEFDVLDEQLRASTGRLAQLDGSLMSRAFTGELTASWRSAHIAQLSQEAAERDRRLGARPTRLLTREDILRTPDSRGLVDAETTLARALDGVAQQIAGSTKLLSSTLQTLAHSPVMTMVQQLQLQYAEMFDSLTLRAVRQIADDQQRILASMTEPLRQMTGVTQRVMQDLQPIRGLLAQFAETARLALAEPDPSHPRYHLLCSLSREQYTLYLVLQTAEGYLRPEAMAEEGGLPLDTVQRDLDLLVTVGLAQRVNVATMPSDKLVYVPAYRRVRPSDSARLVMMERLTPQESAL